MEADWAVEIGPGSPVIEALWPGFVNLRFDPRLPSGALLKRAQDLTEAADLPGLAEALVRLNSLSSPVWTSKCDVWPVDAGEIDPYELEATPQEARFAQACYLDLLPRNNKDDRQWTTPEMAVLSCRSLCNRLHELPLSACRLDLVVRLAVIAPSFADHDLTGPDLTDHGITAYLTACGATAPAARQRLALALAAFTDALSPQSR
jgi:hypothetical protein